MRATGWILATALIAGLVATANGGQSGCAGCIGAGGPWPVNVAALSGEACCSPNGYAGHSALPGCCCTNHRPCCDNAWDGYCEHHARVQAFWTRVGTGAPVPRCCPGVPRRTLAEAYAGRRCVSDCQQPCPCQQSAPTAVPTRAAPTATPAPAVEPTPAPPSAAPAAKADETYNKADEAFRKPVQRWSR
jgi:hypothetical protein